MGTDRSKYLSVLKKRSVENLRKRTSLPFFVIF